MFDKIKALSKETLIYGTNTIIGRFLNFLFVPLYTNIFAPDEFGIIANIYAYIAILNVFFTIGLESGYFRFASTLEEGNRKENFTHPFLGIFVNSLLLSGILFLFAGNLNELFLVDDSRIHLIRYTAVILFFDAVSIVPFAYLRLQHKAVHFVTLKILNIVINVTLNFILILVFKWGIESVLISNVIASVITFITVSPIIYRNFSLSLNRNLAKELLKFSLPYIPAGISSNLVQVINRPMLYAITGSANSVGIFQANYKLGIFMMLFVSMFEFAWRPFFMQNFMLPDAKKLFSKIMTIFVIAGSFIFIVLSLFIEDIVKIPLLGRGTLVGKAYWSGLAIVPIILFAYLLYGVYINLMAGIYIKKKTKFLPFITGGAALINIIVNILLIPSLDIYGAAISTLLSYFAMTAGIYVVSHKYYPIQYEYSKIITVFIIIGAIYITNFYIAGNLISVKILLLLIFIISIFAFRIMNIRAIKDFVRSKN
ncbi:MAG: oligosaccharide flippase family protein [Ignavibacteria bacterium]|nr:oligosaccharide flippase family protein [Ignavibacteria bacterium]